MDDSSSSSSSFEANSDSDSDEEQNDNLTDSKSEDEDIKHVPDKVRTGHEYQDSDEDNSYSEESNDIDCEDDVFLTQERNDTSDEELFEGDYCIKTIWESGSDDDDISEDLAANHAASEQASKSLDCESDDVYNVDMKNSTKRKVKTKPSSVSRHRSPLEYEFLQMNTDEEHINIAVKLWNEKMVPSKVEAAKMANRFKTYQDAILDIQKRERKKEKRIRKIQTEYNLTCAEEALKVKELTSSEYSEREVAIAVQTVGIEKAKKYLGERDKRLEKNIRRLMSTHNCDREQCLTVIKFMELEDCDEKMAVHLCIAYGEEGARTQWKEITHKFENPKLGELYKKMSASVNAGSKVHIALQLFEMGFHHEDILAAADSLSTLEDAVLILTTTRNCLICGDDFTTNKMVILVCAHCMCFECGKKHFTNCIKDHTSVDAVACPLGDCEYKNTDVNYFNYLETLLKPILDVEVYDLFQKKVRNLAMEKDKFFIWCKNCVFGFMFSPILKVIACPECKFNMCAKCKEEWTIDHENKTCEELANTKLIAPSVNVINMILQDRGIVCPHCKSQFELARGGCMHIQCTSCRYEFCEGCSKEFSNSCTVYDDCGLKGFHAHHPRHCRYYLRDLDVGSLEQLFELNKQEVPVNDQEAKEGKCQILMQKSETGPEENCDKPVKENQMGLCEEHYKDHLIANINRLKLDPVNVLSLDALSTELIRCKKPVPVKNNENEADFNRKLIEAVITEIPYGS